MIVQRTYDVIGIWQFMTQPDMWATVAEDGQQPDDFKPDVNGECWLAVTVDGKRIALFQIQQRNAITIEIHAQVAVEHRNAYSGACGEAVLRWITDNEPGCQKIIAWIPSIYPNVRDFAVRQGFQIEGINRASYQKNGKIHDQWLLGITRGEVDEQRS